MNKPIPNINLITEIKLSGRSQVWLSKKTKISESYISGFCTGRRVPDDSQKAKISKALGKGVTILFPNETIKDEQCAA